MAQLQSGDQQHVAKTILDLADNFKQNEDALTAAGSVPFLVALLRSDQPAVQEPAATALDKFAGGSQQNRDAIIAADALSKLAALLRSDQSAV